MRHRALIDHQVLPPQIELQFEEPSREEGCIFPPYFEMLRPWPSPPAVTSGFLWWTQTALRSLDSLRNAPGFSWLAQRQKDQMCAVLTHTHTHTHLRLYLWEDEWVLSVNACRATSHWENKGIISLRSPDDAKPHSNLIKHRVETNLSFSVSFFQF